MNRLADNDNNIKKIAKLLSRQSSDLNNTVVAMDEDGQKLCSIDTKLDTVATRLQRLEDKINNLALHHGMDEFPNGPHAERLNTFGDNLQRVETKLDMLAHSAHESALRQNDNLQMTTTNNDGIKNC